MDIRHCLRTDATWREGNIDWSLSTGLVRSYFNFEKNRIYLTQGFIGATMTDQTTTLGREGSDYSAAIIANMLDAESVTIWKDVPGIMNADPNKFATTQKLDMLSYREAVEMTYYGAKVIHPKTMKPLVEKDIPLYVRSFLEPYQEGSVICRIDHIMNYVPVFISKAAKKKVLLLGCCRSNHSRVPLTPKNSCPAISMAMVRLWMRWFWLPSVRMVQMRSTLCQGPS